MPVRTGDVITEVRAYGRDTTATGYIEAAVWSTRNASVSPSFLSSSFGGTWQNSGIAAAPGAVNCPIFPTADADHTVVAGRNYKIGFAVDANTNDIWVTGFLVTLSTGSFSISALTCMPQGN